DGAVEVREVLHRHRAQLRDVEVGVARDEGIERPLDDVDTAFESPCALVQLHRVADRTTGEPRTNTGDMTVQRVTLGSGVEADRPADELLAGERADDVVPGLPE